MSTWRAAIAACLLSWLAACGGGGDSGEAYNAPPAALAQDTEPEGTRVDLSDRQLFPMASGDTWTYDLALNGTTAAAAVVRTIAASGDSDVFVTETRFGTPATTHYRRTAQGLLLVDPLAGIASASVRRVVGDLLEVPQPFYAEGADLETVRQGSWGEDVDGDGHPEGYRLEYRRRFVGLEDVALPLGSAQAAHLRNVVVLTLYPSTPGSANVTTSATEDSWWAPRIGLVRAERRVEIDGSASLETLSIRSGTVAGQALFVAPPVEYATKVALLHNDLVFDGTRGVYYASIPGSVVGKGNSIATIDAATGAIVYSRPIGSEPFALGLSPDSSALYVGLNGAGEVVALALPSFTETGRVRLPAPAFYGQTLAEKIAASPTEPGVFAVSLRRQNVSPRHGGVVLVRNLAIQPLATQEHTGSNLIAFDADGQTVYGFNNETTEFGLRRIAVRSDGLVQGLVVTAGGGAFSTRTLEAASAGVLLGNTVFRGTDLAPLGQVAAPGGGCRSIHGTARLVCFESSFVTHGVQRLVVADSTSFVTLATPTFADALPSDLPTEIVPGPAGQVALRMGNTYSTSAATEVWLLDDDALR